MELYVDGASSGNPGPGGFGVVVIHDNGKVETYSKHFDYTTNNEMELSAILYAMAEYGKENPIVYSDSAYAIGVFTDWMFSWQKRGWLKADKKVPENLGIVQAFYLLWERGYRIDLRKVKGHSGNKWNEMADKLATGKI